MERIVFLKFKIECQKKYPGGILRQRKTPPFEVAFQNKL
jgi:hypothetical protein